MGRTVTLDKLTVTAILVRLARVNYEGASQLYSKLMGSWGHRPDRQRVQVPLSEDELGLIDRLNLPRGIADLGVVPCKWQATYRHPQKPSVEVKVSSVTKPPKRRSFSVAGGRVRLQRVSVQRINQSTPKEAAGMATRAKSKKKVEEDELDELEGLEELDDLEDLDEDDEDEEPEDEDEEEEEEEPKPRSKSKSKAKAKPAKSRSRKKVVDDDDDEEDDDEEDEEPPRKKGKTRQAAAKTKAKSSTKRQPPGSRPLPEGRYGPQEIADEAGIDARTVRVFLRAHEDEFPKDEESFRYSFNKRDMLRVVKAIKKSRSE